ncbi:MAG: hypothetical protein J1F07_08450 [Muribaculaceae bacterium]|nr:hypothetical protein [Muribaculaceae bacterium]
MKFNKLFFLSVAAGLALSSCSLDNDNDGNNNYVTNTYPCCNLVIPAAGEAPFATVATYNLTFYTTTGDVSISTTDLVLGYGTQKFTSSTMPSETKFYSVDWTNQTLDVTSFAGGSCSENGLVIQNIKGYASSVVNVLGSEYPIISDYPYKFRIPLVMSYTANHDYTVKTFMPDAIYRGTNNVVGGNMDGSVFTSEDLLLRVVFSDNLKSADVIFYNAKFSSMMPRAINFVLKDLPVTYTKDGYEIKNPDGKPVNPWMYEGGGLTEMPSYQFTSFEFLNTSSDLTSGMASYTVQMGPSAFPCTFSGSYVYSGEQK